MSALRSPAILRDVDACAETILARVGKRIVLGLPVGIGKPNPLINALTRRVLADRSLHLTIFTALSLRKPRGHSDLERRFLEPFAQRVFGDYLELEYVQLLERHALPSNIEICEFFLEPGAWLTNSHLQQHYLSANYTHVVRDLTRRGLNVVAQWVAPSPVGENTYSLSCNPDLTVDLLPYFRARRAQGEPCLLVGEIHRQLPFMYGDAVLAAGEFDLLLDDVRYEPPLFCPPNMPIGTTDYAIALNVSSLVRDGGTLQLGIGELGDAIVYGLKLRHERPSDFAALMGDMGTSRSQSQLIADEGGLTPFARGVYGCTEMLVDGFIDLYRAGILKRRVFPHVVLQQVLDGESATINIDEQLLEKLCDAGLTQLSSQDFTELQAAGLFRAELTYRESNIVNRAGEKFAASLATSVQRHALAEQCLGRELSGVLVHGGFFFGPKAFYETLRTMPEGERRQFAMQRISFINELYGDEQALKIAQRRDARFVNTTMMVTALGAAVSDGLSDGQVVSGVGGQYNFVAMAHALPRARSILCVRSTRTSNGRTTSNIVWNYGHTTIPRHLRDIVVTEYGIADLRGRTDRETIEAIVQITDARFQDELVSLAKRYRKLPPDYCIPEQARNNRPQKLERAFAPWRRQGLFGELPFGGEFTAEELVLAKALRHLQQATFSPLGKLVTVGRALLRNPYNAKLQPYLRRMSLAQPRAAGEFLQQRLVAWAVHEVLATTV